MKLWAFEVKSCYKCTDRKLGCHSVCEKYISACKKHKELTEKYYAERRKQQDLIPPKQRNRYYSKKYET